MNKQLAIILLMVFSYPAIAISQERTLLKNSTELKKKLIKQSATTKSIIAEFTQEKHVSFMKAPQISKGKFYYQQHDKMRWEQLTPFNYVLLINNEKIRIKDNGKEKNIKGVNKMMGKINKLMLGLINGKIFENKDFTSKYFSDKDSYIVELNPNNKRLKGIFNSIELTFSKKTSRLKTLKFFESSGDVSLMNFFNDKFNVSIEASIFNKL